MLATKPNTALRLARRFIDAAKVRRLRSMREFAESEIVLPEGPYAGLRYRCERQPYSGLLFDSLQDGRWWRKVITGPSQSGKTLQAFLVPLLYHLFEVGENVICGVPNLDMAGDKWESDIKPIIEASRYRDLLPTRGQGSRGGTPRVVWFANGVRLLFMAGGGGDKQRAGATSRVLVVTETDGMDDIGLTSREGSKLAQLEARTLSHAKGNRRLHYFECTVSTEDGYTWQQYESGTASRIIVPCVHCGAWVTPERAHLVRWEDAETEAQAEREAAFACPECGQLWSASQRSEMNARNRLLHRGEEVTETGDIVGTPAETNTLGFRWSAFNNEFIEPSVLGAMEWKAKQSDDAEAAEIALKQFVWCLPREDERVDAVELTVGIVRGSARGYVGRCSGEARGVVPAETECTTLMVDIGQRFLHWAVMAFGRQSHVVDYGVEATLHSDVVGPEAAIQAALPELLDSLLSRWSINQGLVDCGHWRHVILPIVSRYPVLKPSHGLGKSGEGSGNYVHPPKATSDGRVPSPNGEPWYTMRNERPRAIVVNFDADYFKTVLHNAIQIRPLKDDQSVANGCVRLFGEKPEDHAEFARHIVAERLETVYEPGKKPKTTWVRRQKANHWLDCLVGCLVARSMCSAQVAVVQRRYGVLSKRN